MSSYFKLSRDAQAALKIIPLYGTWIFVHKSYGDDHLEQMRDRMGAANFARNLLLLKYTFFSVQIVHNDSFLRSSNAWSRRNNFPCFNPDHSLNPCLASLSLNLPPFQNWKCVDNRSQSEGGYKLRRQRSFQNFVDQSPSDQYPRDGLAVCKPGLLRLPLSKYHPVKSTRRPCCRSISAFSISCPCGCF